MDIMYRNLTPEEIEDLRVRKLSRKLNRLSNEQLILEYTKLAVKGSKDAILASRVILERMN